MPTSNKLSSFLHLSWGSLVSCVWQASCLQERFESRESRASSRGKLSSLFQTTGKRRSFSLPPSLCLSLFHPPILPSVSACSPGEDLHFPTACYAPLSLTVQNKQMGVRGWNTKLPRGAGPTVFLTYSQFSPAGPQQPSQYASWEWHQDRQLDWGERRSMCPS